MWGKKIPGRRTTKRTGILEESTTICSKNSKAITVAVANVGKRRGQKVWV